MGALNESLRVEDMPADDRAAFRGEPTRVLLRTGSRLFRVLTEGVNRPLGAWWMPESTYRLVEMRAQRLGVTVAQFTRSKLAVQRDWNPSMNRICSAILLRDAFGIEGPASHQRLSADDAQVLLPGNFVQVWIPNLSEREARVTYLP